MRPRALREAVAAPVYTWIVGEGHAWLGVPFETCRLLGIEKEISRYSYEAYEVRGGRVLYLEEDRDAFLFRAAAQAHSFAYFTEDDYQRRPRIRDFSRYEARRQGERDLAEVLLGLLSRAKGARVEACAPRMESPTKYEPIRSRGRSVLPYYAAPGDVFAVFSAWPGSRKFSPSAAVCMKRKAFEMHFEALGAEGK